MPKWAKIAIGVVVGVLLLGGLAGGLVTSFTGGDENAKTATLSDRNVSTSCYLDDQPARIGDCQPAPAWLHNYPQALDKDNQPLPFIFKNVNWEPIISSTSGADTQGKFCPATGEANPNDNTDEIYFAGCEPFSLTWKNSANPAQQLISDGTVVNLNAQQPDNSADQDKVSRANLQNSSLYLKWKAANPMESQKIDAYWNCADRCAPPDGIVTAYGKAYLAQGEAYHYARGDHN